MGQNDHGSDDGLNTKPNGDVLEVHIVDPVDTSAPILQELSESLNFRVRWFKSAQELEIASPWKPPQTFFISSVISVQR